MGAITRTLGILYRVSDNQVIVINGRGDIVGCHDAMSGFVSFRVESGERRQTIERLPLQQKLASCAGATAAAINDSRVMVGHYFRIGQLSAFLAIPELTLNVSGPAVHSSVTNPLHLGCGDEGSETNIAHRGLDKIGHETHSAER